jgi:single-strand DNA-binding protein
MINRVILVGRLTKDPEMRFTQSGKGVTSFTLAVKRTFKNAQGEYEADFVNCIAWNNAENVANYLKKGSLAGVDGRIQTRNFEGQDGKRVFMTEVVAESVQFLEPKNSQSSNQGQSQNNNQQQSQNQRQDEDPFKNDGTPIDISDDDLPF